ncbi:hypothetical protein [Campylobacter sp. RM16187]|uniref:hypothetical protein n=1 Tax=Campylobacter sp. RM16187 TaxID=1660063 RepID=UPI0021B4EEE9|nr:hypothetical protein [Campylobacter sp. RM16187]QKG28606.1 hypothetical protein CDOMF_0317 [Campylobacter sp. RM16187]
MIYQLPTPKSFELFESIVCDLLNNIHNTTSFSLYGRNGQKQHGVDILSYEKNIICQCKLRNHVNSKSSIRNFINDVKKDIEFILKSNNIPRKIIIATTLENDTFLQNNLNGYLALNNSLVCIEFWSREYISNYIFSFREILNKYYPFREQSVEIASIKILNKSIYQKSNQNSHLFKFQNIKNRNQLPIFDVSFINNTENTILLNSIEVYSTLLPIAKAGSYEKPAGILKITKKILVDIKIPHEINKEYRNDIELQNPIYANPKSAFRIQVQNTKPIVSYLKIKLYFRFNQTTISTPNLYFNGIV